ncbi:hypothetical protein HNQ36_003477 [Afipia massiliensis]|uniref:Uncharacterized protein n=1 Tax=Afipia massiliensis TaxID=211460 RepID=A0A840N4K3_9BRAD|nr:hypothetical protein [Afipia massiliensis]MBB5053477.1 hypothetical protein [Afipia massiliensis]
MPQDRFQLAQGMGRDRTRHPQGKSARGQAAKINVAIRDAFSEQPLDQRCRVLLFGRKIEILYGFVHAIPFAPLWKWLHLSGP